jgi:methyl-accepting chemotaxis protein
VVGPPRGPIPIEAELIVPGHRDETGEGAGDWAPIAVTWPWNRFVVRLLVLALVISALLIGALSIPLNDQPLLSILIRGLAIAVAVVSVLLFAWSTTRPIDDLSRAVARAADGKSEARVAPAGPTEVRNLGALFNALMERYDAFQSAIADEGARSTATLSAAASQLQAAANQQTSAAATTSAHMEALAHNAVSIAESVEGVTVKAGELRANIDLVRTDLKESSGRTNDNAKRVNEIQGILVLLNDIADQTNLLALNAAIEAARAGDAGRGFAVVADEVRRLAERSKAAAAQIALLVEGAQKTSGEAVMAIERRGEQLEHWMAMTRAMADTSGQVLISAQQQRSATDEALHAVEGIAEGSRSVAAAAQDIAAATSSSAALTGSDSGMRLVPSHNGAGHRVRAAGRPATQPKSSDGDP